jgi:hypothetical protein
MEKISCNCLGPDDIVAVRHDLPHMPSLGVSSLDSRPPWRHGGLLFCRDVRGKITVPGGRDSDKPRVLYALSRQTDDAAAMRSPQLGSFSAEAVAVRMMLPCRLKVGGCGRNLMRVRWAGVPAGRI